MKASRIFSIAAALALGTALSACNNESSSEETTEAGSGDSSAADAIKARQAALKKISDANKAIKAAMEAGSPDLSAVAASASEMNSEAVKLATLFPAGSGKESGEKTEALPAIWEKPEEFSSALAKLVDGSAALAAAASSGDAAATAEAAKEVGGSCKNCHMSFREKKK